MTEVPTQDVPGAPRRNGLFLWAVGGVLLLLSQAIFRLSQVAWEALATFELTQAQIAITAAWALASSYMEGYRGFQLRFVPRVLARAHYLAQNPGAAPVLLAPLYAMAFFRAKTRAKVAAWGISLLVLAAILIVRNLPQPWRGIIDVGVVVGLSWGVVCMVWGVIHRLQGAAPAGDPELSVRHSQASHSRA
jgi:hypothetical protein